MSRARSDSTRLLRPIEVLGASTGMLALALAAVALTVLVPAVSGKVPTLEAAARSLANAGSMLVEAEFLPHLLAVMLVFIAIHVTGDIVGVRGDLAGRVALTTALGSWAVGGVSLAVVVLGLTAGLSGEANWPGVIGTTVLGLVIVALVLVESALVLVSDSRRRDQLREELERLNHQLAGVAHSRSAPGDAFAIIGWTAAFAALAASTVIVDEIVAGGDTPVWLVAFSLVFGAMLSLFCFGLASALGIAARTASRRATRIAILALGAAPSVSLLMVLVVAYGANPAPEIVVPVVVLGLAIVSMPVSTWAPGSWLSRSVLPHAILERLAMRELDRRRVTVRRELDVVGARIAETLRAQRGGSGRVGLPRHARPRRFSRGSMTASRPRKSR